MGKRISIGGLKTRAVGMVTDIKTHWNKPRPGEFVTDKQFFSFCASGLFTDMWWHGPGMIGSFGVSWFCGSMMGIVMKDFVTINMIGMVLGYVFIFMSPVGMLIYENHGRLNKSEKILMHSVTLTKIAVGFALYFFPASFMQNTLRGFPYILANALFLGGITDYINWFVRYKFSPKHGRLKPFMVLSALPSVALGIAMPWINFTAFDYPVKIAMLHGCFQVLGWFSSGFLADEGMPNFMSQNSQERQRLFSYAPILKGLLSSLTGIFMPMIITRATLFGHSLMGYEDIWTYRLLGPIFGGMSLLGALFILPVKENLIEQKINRPKVQFFKGSKQVFQNKYWWINNLTGLFGAFNHILGNFFTFWVVYQKRETWTLGFTGTLMIFGGTIGAFFVPMITKRFNKVKIVKYGRVAAVVILGIQMLLYKMDLFWPYIIFTFIAGPIRGICDGIGSGFGADILDYHQWKTGERADSLQGVFGWIFNPLNTLFSYIGPYIYVRLGYTSDWAIFHNTEIFTKVFDYTFLLALLGGLLSTIPFVLLYDLMPDKHKKYIEEIQERVREKDIGEILQHKENGTLHEIEPELLEKYGFDAEGNQIEHLEEEPAEELLVPAEVES